MEVTGASGKSANSSFSFRYNASNEELEELYSVCQDDPSTLDVPQANKPEGSPKKSEKSSSIIDKYFKSSKIEKNLEKFEEDISKVPIDTRPINVYAPKDVTCSPVKEYLHRFSRKHTVSESLQEAKEKEKEGPNETWRLFHDFKSKFAQAVEDIKHRSNEDKEKSVPRDSSISDSEENSIIKDSDLSVGDTDNQVSSLHSSLQNLSEITPPATAKEQNDKERSQSDSTDDTHKHCETPDYTLDHQDDPSLLDVESGVEALEEINIEGIIEPDKTDGTPVLQPTDSIYEPIKPPPGTPIKTTPSQINKKSYFFNFSMYFLSFILIVDYLFFPNALIWNGFCFGLWAYCFVSNLFVWIVDTYFKDSDEKSFLEKKSSSDFQTYTIPSIKEHKPLEKFIGWVNHYRYPEYDPFSYHINKTTSAFIKLEGCNLRISYTKMKVPKRALWDEKIENPTFYQHRLYNLTGARVILLPKGLVERRQWTKKYPICIILSEKEKIQVLEKESTPTERRLSESQTVEKKTKDNQTENESTETNTSPERKRKFIWRRREKSADKYENEPGREGLRQRIVRKIHKEKKSELAPVPDPPEIVIQEEFSEPDDMTFQDAEENTKFLIGKDEADDDLEEGEILRIKDFLEEAETESCVEGATEGEWSVHVKHTTALNHKFLYLFARTGREKHDWYRRFKSCISENSKGSAESSTAEDKGSFTDSTLDKDEIEMTAYRLSDKDVVSFKSSKADGQSDAVTIQSTSQPQIPTDSYSIEKLFWPYFFKIIQMKGSSSECTCRPLSPHVAWLNSLISRVAFDVMRDPQTIARLQLKIQRKLHSLKLPSFMSPLQVTKLSLEGACPLISRISPPTWDERGLWVDIELRYEGGAYISILTQMNLMKLKEKGEKRDDFSMDESTLGADNELETDSLLNNDGASNETLLMKRKPAIFQSDLEDSAESSSDDESPPIHPVDSTENVAVVDPQSSPIAESASSKKKFLRMVDRIATNKYFQTVTEYKYVKRAMEGLSNTDIKLQLDINGLEGTLAVNLPPPPHDRVWIGFRKNPQLLLKARPAFGARTLRIAHITNWIEQKLSKEFERILVLPNMEDIHVDVLTPTPAEFE